MKKLDADEFAERMADEMTHCYASTRGCKKLPVRMLVEGEKDNPQLFNMVMLCVDHAATYRPEGPVMFDQTVGDENIEVIKKASW